MIDYKNLVEDSIDGMFIIQNEQMVYVNDAFASILGFLSVNEFYERNLKLADLMPKESILSILQQQTKHNQMLNQNKRRYVIECYHQNGQSLYVEVFSNTRRNDSGIMLYGTIMNVSESIKLWQELFLFDQSNRQLFEYNTNLIFSFDLNGRFASMNSSVTKTLGYSFEELIHVNFEQFIHSEDTAIVLKKFNEAKSYGQHCSYEAKVIHKSGEIRHTHIMIIPIYIEDEIVGVYGIAHDITEFKKPTEQYESLDLITKNHCDEAQGCLLSNPIPVNGLIESMKRKREPSKYAGDERRKLFRIVLKEEEEMELTIVSIKGKPVSVGYTVTKVLDIGPGGLSISLGANLPISSDIIYQFSGNFHGEELSVQGNIVWMEEFSDDRFHYGFSFIYKNEKEQLEFIQLLNRVSIKQRK